MKNLIKEYLKISIETKKGLKKNLKKMNDIIETIAQAEAEQNLLLEEFKKESYKTKYLEEHKKYKELLKKYKEEIK